MSSLKRIKYYRLAVARFRTKEDSITALLVTIFALLALAPAALASEHAEAHKTSAAPKPMAMFITADEIKWAEAPPSLPKGAQITVLHGDPSKKGLYTMRLKMPDGYKIPAHWHTQDEQLTILSGTFVLHMGDKMDAAAPDLDAGSYHFLPGRMHHSAETKGETVLQINAMGPFDIHYLNPADNPNKTAAARPE